MLTRKDLESRGWTFVDDTRAEHEDGRATVVGTDQAPLFHLLAHVSVLEEGIEQWPAHDDITPALVKKTTGEKYVKPEPWKPTPEQHEEKLIELREQRDRLLRATDHYASFILSGQPADLPAKTKAALTKNADAWLAYRDALRDYPATVDNSYDPPAFPTPPSAPALRA